MLLHFRRLPQDRGGGEVMACDMCSKKDCRLNDLHEWLKSKNVKQVCDRCLDSANAEFSRLDKIITRWKRKRFKQFFGIVHFKA